MSYSVTLIFLKREKVVRERVENRDLIVMLRKHVNTSSTKNRNINMTKVPFILNVFT